MRRTRRIHCQGFATGGKDGKVILWDPEFKKSIKTYELSNKFLAADSRGDSTRCFSKVEHSSALGTLTEEPCSVRAVTLTRRIVVGTRGGEICEIEKDGRIRVAIQGREESLSESCSTSFDPRRSCGRRNVGLEYSSVETGDLHGQRRQNCAHLVVERQTNDSIQSVEETSAHM